MRAVFLVHPHLGGTYSVFLNLRAALAGMGHTVDWLACSDKPDSLPSSAKWLGDLPPGRLLDTRGKSDLEKCRALVAAIESQGYNLVFINVLTSLPEMSVAANLPPHIRRIMIVHNITPGTYAAAKAVAPHVHAIVGVAPRVQQDLIRKVRTSPASTFCVPNAIDLQPYLNIVRSPRTSTFRLLSLGRIVDADKGIFWLPQILHNLTDLPLHLTIAGEGPDLAALKQRCADLAGRVTFIDRISPSSVAALAANHDALLLPSRFEGFGYTLVEAMAAGCVPIASRISGITDFVIRENQTGLLFPIGNAAAAAAHIRTLAADPALRARLAQAGAADVRERFSIDRLARNYQPILDSLPSAPALPTRHGHPFTLLKIGGGWRKYVPKPLKNILRARLFR